LLTPNVWAASIVSIEAQRAAATDEIVPAASFSSAATWQPALTNKVVGDYPAAAATRGVAGLVGRRDTRPTAASDG
jgi:hypothetical protein